MTRLQAVIKEPEVSPQAAHLWQRAARVDEAVVADYIAQAKEEGIEITVAGLLAWAKKDEDDGSDKGDGKGDNGDDDPPTHPCPICGMVHRDLNEDNGGAS